MAHISLAPECVDMNTEYIQCDEKYILETSKANRFYAKCNLTQHTVIKRFDSSDGGTCKHTILRLQRNSCPWKLKLAQCAHSHKK